MFMPRAIVSLLILSAVLSGCGGPSSPSPIATACNPSATSARGATPFFSKPFAGNFPIGNLFDHDKPLVFDDANGYLLTLCGHRDSAKDTGQTDGHDGYDWRMPEGTPIFAVADGLVMFGGLQAAFCPPLNRNVQALYVQVLHRAPDGTEFITIYGHLSRVSVAEGDLITAGATVGLSGNTGCSGTPQRLVVARGFRAAHPVVDADGEAANAVHRVRKGSGMASRMEIVAEVWSGASPES